jgi:nitrogen regulatory protein PII
VVESAIKSGASGATVMFGRGMGIHETQKLFGVCIEPEKEVVLCVVPRTIENKVLEEIVKRSELNKPGMGIAFVIPVEKVFGVVHQQEE